jgi:energy-coupling factor transporter ATP-binding protein EcfA2
MQVEAALRRWAELEKISFEELWSALERFEGETGHACRIYGHDLNPDAKPRQVFDPQSLEVSNIEGTSGRMIEFKPGVTGIFGPNNSGKSTLLNALRFCLKGRAGMGAPTMESILKSGAKKGFVTFTFTGGRIRRELELHVPTKGEKAGVAELKQKLQVQIEGDSSSKLEDGQKIIENWAGADLDFMLRSYFIRQGELTDLMDDDPSKRKAMVYRLMSLSAADETAAAIREWIRKSSEAGATNIAMSADLTEALAVLKRKRNQLPVETLKQNLEKLEAAGDPGAALSMKRQELDAKFTRLRADAERLLGEAKRKGELSDRLNELRKDPLLAASFEDLSVKVTATQANYQLARDARVKLELELAAVKDRGTKLKTLPATCEVCAEMGLACDLGGEKKAARLLALAKEYRSIEARLRSAVDEEYAREAAAREVAKAVSEAEKGRSRLVNIREQIALLEDAISKMPATLEQFATVERQRDQAGHELTEHKKLTIPTDDRPMMRKLLAEAAVLDEQIRSAEERLAKAKAKRDTTGENLLARAFSKDGAPLMLARQHIASINRLVSEITAADAFQYRFNDELEIEVIAPGGALAPPRLVCGSARQRGAFALAAALGRYMQELAQIQVPAFWTDEMPHQDEANEQLVIAMVKSLTKWYPKVIFNACRWEAFQGHFQNQIMLQPEKVAEDLADLRGRFDKLELSNGSEIQVATDQEPARSYVDSGEIVVTAAGEEMAAQEADPGDPF